MKYAEAMHDARVLTETFNEHIWEQHFGSDRFLFLWSDIPGRYFCRYQELTEAPDVHWRDVGVGMGYRPPEGTAKFVSFIAADNVELSQRVAAACSTVAPRDAYFKAYLDWVRGFQVNGEQPGPNTRVYERYLDAEALATAVASRVTEIAYTATNEHAHTVVHTRGASTGRTRSHTNTSDHSCSCSIL